MTPADECLAEIKAFVRGDQFDLLGRVLPNIFKEYNQPIDTATTLLWQGGLDMEAIEHVLNKHGAHTTTATPWKANAQWKKRRTGEVSIPKPPDTEPTTHTPEGSSDGLSQTVRASQSSKKRARKSG